MSGVRQYGGSTYITVRAKRVSSVKHITLIESGGGHVTFLNTLWRKGDGVLKHLELIERREGWGGTRSREALLYLSEVSQPTAAL